MTDWIMIVITFVYVIATSLISVFNYRAAKAAGQQLAESRRQFDESNRPYITVELIHENGSYYALRYTNHGTQAANHVRIELEQSFIDSIQEEKARELLEKQKGREFIIGVSEHYDMFFGSNDYRENEQKEPIAGRILYANREKQYEEPFFIDLDYYMTFFSLHNETEDTLKRLDNQYRALKRIAAALEQAYPPKDAEEKSEDEEDNAD